MEVASSSKVLVNERPAKKGLFLKKGDVISIKFKTKTLKIKVLVLDKPFHKEDAEKMFEVIEES